MSVALVTICQQCYGPVVVVEQLELVPEEDMGWHHAVEVCLAPGCDWWRARDVAELPYGHSAILIPLVPVGSEGDQHRPH